MGDLADQINYSEKYYDDHYEYRHVYLPKEIADRLPPRKLLSEDEWRALGLCMSPGWIHYAIHIPEPHIMLFRRPYNPNPGPLENKRLKIANNNK